MNFKLLKNYCSDFNELKTTEKLKKLAFQEEGDILYICIGLEVTTEEVKEHEFKKSALFIRKVQFQP